MILTLVYGIKWDVFFFFNYGGETLNELHPPRLVVCFDFMPLFRSANWFIFLNTNKKFAMSFKNCCWWFFWLQGPFINEMKVPCHMHCDISIITSWFIKNCNNWCNRGSCVFASYHMARFFNCEGFCTFLNRYFVCKW